jgi:hypothetical protein
MELGRFTDLGPGGPADVSKLSSTRMGEAMERHLEQILHQTAQACRKKVDAFRVWIAC